MSVVFSSDFSSIIRNKYVYLDCDILSAFYHDEIFLKERTRSFKWKFSCDRLFY